MLQSAGSAMLRPFHDSKRAFPDSAGFGAGRPSGSPVFHPKPGSVLQKVRLLFHPGDGAPMNTGA
ncbi:hypothetical protein KPP23_072 [Pseudomonas phage KPP23]|nr:hypothetical protein KPP23_072 [Pseudomonas phage KPP23]